ncbi:hypothetical protein [Saccharicrinis aurantiacus]|uniref:hypothetical protein n=1 Tax=Saccharicrinis aurantiacus TaxID=1849719 RepID=UPI001115147D|nr:hypothetical protein [Saccharicrinis aurantiacus]
MRTTKNERKEFDQSSDMQLVLLQTILEKIELQESQCNDGLIKKHSKAINTIGSAIEKLSECVSDVMRIMSQQTLRQSSTVKYPEEDQYQSQYEKVKRNISLYGIVFIAIIFAFLTVNYSVRYYMVRGNYIKYESLRMHGPSNIQKVVSDIDSLYSNCSYNEYKIKYTKDKN